jgi:hypothetical protein
LTENFPWFPDVTDNENYFSYIGERYRGKEVKYTVGIENKIAA